MEFYGTRSGPWASNYSSTAQTVRYGDGADHCKNMRKKFRFVVGYKFIVGYTCANSDLYT